MIGGLFFAANVMLNGMRDVTGSSGAANSGGGGPTALASQPCAQLTTGAVSKIVGRNVHPIAVHNGCAWGTRLDDPSTTVVEVRTQDGFAQTETNYVTFAAQKRVVYGSASDAVYRPATGLWVTAGQTITGGKKPLVARTETHIVVSKAGLKVSDDKARTMALAVAAAVNTPPVTPSPTTKHAVPSR